MTHTTNGRPNTTVLSQTFIETIEPTRDVQPTLHPHPRVTAVAKARNRRAACPLPQLSGRGILLSSANHSDSSGLARSLLLSFSRVAAARRIPVLPHVLQRNSGFLARARHARGNDKKKSTERTCVSLSCAGLNRSCPRAFDFARVAHFAQDDTKADPASKSAIIFTTNFQLRKLVNRTLFWRVRQSRWSGRWNDRSNGSSHYKDSNLRGRR